ALRVVDGTGIIYCLTVQETDSLTGWLAGRGHDVVPYTGRTPPAQREHIEGLLVDGRVRAVVATSALGMGLDADLMFVISNGSPSSPMEYMQQACRAGRRGDAVAILLTTDDDQGTWEWQARQARP